MKPILIIISILSFSVFNGYAQSDTSFLSRALTSLENYSAANPVEKVHLHLDRDNYMPGDTIWFKAYAVAGQNHGLSAISSILHAELLTPKDSVIARIAMPLSNGVGWADFALPVLIKTGNYHIRAYTNWMRNFAPEYFFDQSIRVSDALSSTVKKQKTGTDLDIRFFAEGGSLVNGLRSKVAIKVVNTHGMGEDVDGAIVDSDGNQVAVFSTQHLGMGMFALLPEAGKSYKAKITSKAGKLFTVDLPKAQDDGFAISINNSNPDSISIRVAPSPKLFQNKQGGKYYLVAQAAGKVYFTADLTLSAQSFITQIDKKRLPTGIVQFTLFAANGEPLNERIAFIKHNDELKLAITSPKKVLAAREKVNISLKAINSAGKPVIGSFSASVINQQLSDINDNDENGILSDLLLTSDIKGYIEQPGYYFANTGDKVNADLDLLMLTQGYHRFEWKQVLINTPAGLVYEPESSLSVSGYLKTFGGKPIANGKVLLYNTRGGWFKLDTTSNENGHFIFKGLIADADTTLKYVIQGRSGTNKNKLDITLDTIAAFKKWKVPANFVVQADTTAETLYQKQIKQQLKISLDKRIIPLKEVQIKSKKDIISTSGQIMRPDQVINDFPKEGTGERLDNFLAVRIRGAIFKGGIPYTLRSMGRTAMPILLNGFVISPDVFQTLQLTDIESAYVLSSTGNIDMASGGQGLFLTTRKNRGAAAAVVPDVIVYHSNGLYKAREFYSPKYGVVNEQASKPDLRQTIFWKPDIITGKDGNAILSFYNADTRGTYRVTVEGVDVDGNLGRQVYTYVVE